MVICFRLDQKSKDELDRLVAEGGYRDQSEAVAVAISNQLLLHSDASATTGTRGPFPVHSFELGGNRDEGETGSRNIAGVPRLFSAITEDRSGVRVAQIAHEPGSLNQVISIDQWIFGQHNKLLPVKATCRALARLLTRELTSYEGVALSKASSEIASEAVLLGDYLRRRERELRLQRDETLAYAFPRSDYENEDRSRLRFATQFVGNTDSQGSLTGLPADLKLVGTDGPTGSRILLTEAGWNFAHLENPILDALPGRPVRKFSSDEVHFLVNHIIETVPAETFAFTTVTRLIESGANTPELLDEALGEFLPTRDAKPFSPAFLTTQRAGVISRLSDLGLVQRVRDGIKVAYAITDQARKYFPNSLHRMA
jgi:hypothetical protein